MSRSAPHRKTPEKAPKKERRRHPRGNKTKTAPRSAKGARSAKSAKNAEAAESCKNCSKHLETDDRALFVEEEIGRVFCSEECITGYFTPDVERLEKEYFRVLAPGDLDPEEREKLAHLRWITLQEPDEVWRQKSLSGDHRYTLISEFRPGSRSIWCVCVCLFLRGEPSFLFISLTSKNAALVNHYRRGERVVLDSPAKRTGDLKNVKPAGAAEKTAVDPALVPMDGLASEWTDEETRRAQMNQSRRIDDIPEAEFELYQTCLEETLQNPTEVWTKPEAPLDEESAEESTAETTNSGEEPVSGDEDSRVFHFVRFYPDETPGMWYVVIAREVDDSDEIEILDAFPTRDSDLVDRYRSGTQEVGEGEKQASSRLVH